MAPPSYVKLPSSRPQQLVEARGINLPRFSHNLPILFRALRLGFSSLYYRFTVYATSARRHRRKRPRRNGSLNPSANLSSHFVVKKKSSERGLGEVASRLARKGESRHASGKSFTRDVKQNARYFSRALISPRRELSLKSDSLHTNVSCLRLIPY